MYSWTASVTAANQTVTDEGSRQALSGSLGHNVMRSFMQTEESQASINLGQSVTTVYDTVDRSTWTLTHSAGLSWNRSRESGTLDFAGATISDSHSWGATQGDFQLLNLQATRQATLSRVSSWSGNLTIQATRQHAEAIAPSPVLPLSVPQTQSRAVSYSANLTYEHQRAFGINNLRFSALATANSQQLQSRQQGDINAPPEFIDNSVEIRFDYLIGRLLIRLSARSAEISDRRQNQILLRITRSFGSL